MRDVGKETKAAWVLIGLSICIGIVTRSAFLTHYTAFEGDQVRDAYLYAGMRSGAWPTLGPITSVSVYSLPPLYYYLVFPFSLLGSDPFFQVLPNALCSIFSIPLLIFTIYQLLDGLFAPRRLLFAAAAGLWQSLMIVDIVLSAKEWNPSPTPFFLLLFVLIIAAQLRHRLVDRLAFPAWAALGVIVALLVSFHGTALYVIPVAFGLFSAAFIFRASSKTRAAAAVFVGWLVTFACLAPYWQGEAARHWSNTQAIFSVARESASHQTAYEHIEKAIRPYLQLAGECYFPGGNRWLLWGGLVFVVVILPTALTRFRGDRALFGTSACMWALFLVAAGNYRDTDVVHYKVLILQAPIFLAAASIAYLDRSSIRDRVPGVLLAVGVFASVAANTFMDVRYATNLFGRPRLTAVSDIVEIIKEIPDSAFICGSPYSYHYIDGYMTHRRLRFVDSCAPGIYAIIPSAAGSSDFVYDGHYRFDVAATLAQLSPTALPSGVRVVARTDAVALVVFLK